MNGNGPLLEEREFFLELRRGLIYMIQAIEKRYRVGRYEPEEKSLAPQPNKRR